MMYPNDDIEAPNFPNFWGVKKIKCQAGTCYFWACCGCNPRNKRYIARTFKGLGYISSNRPAFVSIRGIRCAHKAELNTEVWWFRLLPRSLTWNLKMMVSKRNLLFQGLLFRFHVKFQGCTPRKFVFFAKGT